MESGAAHDSVRSTVMRPPATLRALVAAVALVVALTSCGRSTQVATSAPVTPPADWPGSVDGAGGAVRDVIATPGASCDEVTLRALAERHPEVGQWVVVRSDGWTATAAFVDVAARRRDGTWVCERGGQPAMVGRSGTRPLLDRRSGDGTAPAGVFPLGTTTAWDGQAFQFFGNGPDPGVRGAYRAVRTGDCWGATPGAASYNHLVRSSACAGPDDEYLPSITGAYVHAAVIGANNEPSVSGDDADEIPFAAAIFLHRHAYDGSRAKPTSGCVSLAIEDLVPSLVLLDPRLTPHFAIGPTDWLRTEA